MIADPREIQRLRYQEGQDLLSRDFRDGARFEEQLRWWHNRAAHGVFGVRYGLGVTLSGQGVEVGGGLAYDCFGRELILPTDRELPVPTPPGDGSDRILVIRFREGDGAPSPGELAGVCFGGPVPRGAELAWIGPRRLRATDGVPLARVGFEGEVPILRDDFQAPAARPLARPRLGSGSTVAGGTAWEIWNLGRQSLYLGLQVRIETRAAGFTEPPCCFAWLQGDIRVPVVAGGTTETLLPLFPYVAEVTLTDFRFRILTFAAQTGSSTTLDPVGLLGRARQRLSVCWLGIQMRSDEHALPEVIHGHP
jgi:hypothetical protein